MLFQAIENSNLLLKGDPSLNIVDVRAVHTIEDGFNAITIAFEPTPDELRRLNAGHPVYVTQLGNSFHPIRCEVKP